MMSRSMAFLVMWILLLAALPAAAQGPDYNSELSFSAYYVDLDVEGESLKITNLTGDYGWMFAGGHELEFLVGYWKLDLGDSIDGITYGLGYSYNFLTDSTIVPYLGAEIAKVDGDMGDVYDMTWAAVGGIKVYPWDHGGFRFAVRWGQLSSDVEGLDDADLLALEAGMVLRF